MSHGRPDRVQLVASRRLGEPVLIATRVKRCLCALSGRAGSCYGLCEMDCPISHTHSAIRPPSLCLTIRTSGLLSGALEHATSTTRRPLSAACCLRLWQSRRCAYRLVCSWHPILEDKSRPATRLEIQIQYQGRSWESQFEGWGGGATPKFIL